MSELLDVRDLSVFYGARAQAVEKVGFTVGAGQVVALLGANGAGKTSVMKALSGLVKSTGQIRLNGEPIEAMSTRQRVARGLIYVPEGRQIVGSLTVRENLVLGGYALKAETRRQRMEMVLDLFPEIASKANGAAWRLSGGEQQMLAIGRGLMAGPKLLLLDEPSLGLAPLLVRRVFDRLSVIRQENDLAIVLVEQNLQMTMRLADRIHFLRSGRIVGRKERAELMTPEARQEVIDAYLGAAAHAEA